MADTRDKGLPLTAPGRLRSCLGSQTKEGCHQESHAAYKRNLAAPAVAGQANQFVKRLQFRVVYPFRFSFSSNRSIMLIKSSLPAVIGDLCRHPRVFFVGE
jgi:hypothetical protein